MVNAKVIEEAKKLTHDAKNVVCNVLSAAEIIELEMEDLPDNSKVIREMLFHIKSSASQLMGLIEKLVTIIESK